MFFWSAPKWLYKWSNRVFCKKKIQNWNIFHIIVGLEILVFCRCNEYSGKATFFFLKKHQSNHPPPEIEENQQHTYFVNQHWSYSTSEATVFNVIPKKNSKLEHFSDNCEIKNSCFSPLQFRFGQGKFCFSKTYQPNQPPPKIEENQHVTYFFWSALKWTDRWS